MHGAGRLGYLDALAAQALGDVLHGERHVRVRVLAAAAAAIGVGPLVANANIRCTSAVA